MRFFQRVEVWGSWLTGLVLASVLIVHAAQTTDLERRLGLLEGLGAEHRLTSIETRLDSIEFLGKTILGVVIAQLVIGGFGLRRREPEGQHHDRSRRD